jgi:uncharacterized protein (UPF0332 family)
MTLDDLEAEGFIKKLPVDANKIRDALALAQRDITTARSLLGQDADWAFSIAYNAILQTIRALMFSQGYRPNGSNQHVSAVRFAELFLDPNTVIVFDRMRRKRHASLYDTVGTISVGEAKMAIATAESVLTNIRKKLNHK